LRSTPVAGLRQLGDQEGDILAMAAPVCKWTHSLLDPLDAPAIIAKAWMLCQQGRPGPVWIDIPIDLQSSHLPDLLAERGLAGAFDSLSSEQSPWASGHELAKAADDIARQIAHATRPLMLWGSGVGISGCSDALRDFAEAMDCPVCTAWTHDTLESAHRLHAGRPGTIGTRAGNLSLQSADLVVVLGSRLNVRQTSYNFPSFAKNARIIHVDIDPAEFKKPGVRIDQTLCADLRTLATELVLAAARMTPSAPSKKNWIAWIADRKQHFPNVPPSVARGQMGRDNFINPYAFVDRLVRELPHDAIIATGNASACILPFQCAEISRGQRLFSNSGCASMGYDIPAAIGAAVAAPRRTVICLAGDGSAQLNIQELETIARLRLPIKIVILDNQGYLSIRSSQSNFFGRLAGCSPESGVGFPDYVLLAQAYGLRGFLLDLSMDWQSALRDEISKPGPCLIRALLDPQQGFEPRMSSRRLPDGSIVSPELEDMHPFLEREELALAMNLDHFYGPHDINKPN
jgi:acetolactate synthase-1/2/3 large subunit